MRITSKHDGAIFFHRGARNVRNEVLTDEKCWIYPCDEFLFISPSVAFSSFYTLGRFLESSRLCGASVSDATRRVSRANSPLSSYATQRAAAQTDTAVQRRTSPILNVAARRGERERIKERERDPQYSSSTPTIADPSADVSTSMKSRSFHMHSSSRFLHLKWV